MPSKFYKLSKKQQSELLSHSTQTLVAIIAQALTTSEKLC